MPTPHGQMYPQSGALECNQFMIYTPDCRVKLYSVYVIYAGNGSHIEMRGTGLHTS